MEATRWVLGRSCKAWHQIHTQCHTLARMCICTHERSCVYGEGGETPGGSESEVTHIGEEADSSSCLTTAFHQLGP